MDERLSRTAARADAERVALFAMDTVFSRVVLRRLSASGIARVQLLVLPKASLPGIAPIRVPNSESIIEDAHALGVAVAGYETVSAFHERLRGLDPDYLLVACFPEILPPTICRMGRRACLNLHPSLLPRYRGPAPVFWQFRYGERELGVTLHRVAPEVDAGAVAARRAVRVPAGASPSVIDETLAQTGAALFLECVSNFERVRFEPQDESCATWHRLPAEIDCRVYADWPVLCAFNFLRATWRPGGLHEVVVGRKIERIGEVLEMHDGFADMPGRTPAGCIDIPFRDGWIRARGGDRGSAT